MAAAHRQGLHVHQAAIVEHRRRGRAAAHVDADGAQVHLVLFQRGQGGDERSCNDSFKLKMRPLHAGPERLEHRLGHRDHQQLHRQGASEHGPGITDTALAVHRPGHGQDMRRAPARQLDLAQRCLDGAHQVGVGDSSRAQAHPAGHPMAGQRAARRADGHALHLHARHVLRPLHRLGDGVGRLVQIDDRAVLHAAGLHIAHPRRGQGPVTLADAVRLHDEARHLRRAQVHGRHHRLAGQGRLQTVARLLAAAVRLRLRARFGSSGQG